MTAGGGAMTGGARRQGGGGGRDGKGAWRPGRDIARERILEQKSEFVCFIFIIPLYLPHEVD